MQVIKFPLYANIILRVSVFLTTLGYLYRFSDDNLKAFSQIYFEWGFSEQTAEIVVDIMSGALWLTLVTLPFRKMRFFSIPGFLALLFELLCLCINSNTQYSWLVIPNHALRLTPFLLILIPWRSVTAIRIMTITTVGTFIGHGLKALFTYPEFIDYILVFYQLINFPIREATATILLHTIGIIDITLGLYILFLQRTRWVLCYMIFWGLITALTRLMYYGQGAWHEVTIRNAHFLIVLLLLLQTQRAYNKAD
jgi:hypothetical protein